MPCGSLCVFWLVGENGEEIGVGAGDGRGDVIVARSLSLRGDSTLSPLGVLGGLKQGVWLFERAEARREGFYALPPCHAKTWHRIGLSRKEAMNSIYLYNSWLGLCTYAHDVKTLI